MGADMSAYHEQAVAFGPGRSLVGVLTTPPQGSDAELPVFVLLNAGVIHRVGANRMHVRLARALAGHGYQAFRFDLSGIGDSDPRDDEADLEKAVRRDIADALAHLEAAQGARSFVLCGLCSGANNSLMYAATDKRVTGAVLMDPNAFRTPRFYLTHYLPRLVRLETWTNILTGRNPAVRRVLDRLTIRPAANAGANAEPDAAPIAGSTLEPSAPATYAGPTREEMDAGLTTLIGRGVELLIIFTGGLPGQYNYAAQFRDTFPRHARSPQVRVEYFGDSDHTFSAESAKVALIGLVTEWLRAHTPNAAYEPERRCEAPYGIGCEGPALRGETAIRGTLRCEDYGDARRPTG